MTLECMTHRLTGVSIGWDQNAFPDNSWFSLAAKAGHALTGVDPKQLEQSIRKCHRQALKEIGGVTELETPNAKIECQALTRNGGGVFISIWDPLDRLRERRFSAEPPKELRQTDLRVNVPEAAVAVAPGKVTRSYSLCILPS
jgi:hypothetical protein